LKVWESKLWLTLSMIAYSDSYSEKRFKKMYGKGAEIIDVTNVPQITKTMNKLFLQK
jgi:hypothetical protein